MVGMVLDAGQIPDDLRHSRRGPQGGGEPMGLRALFEGAFHLAKLAGRQPGLAPGSPGLFQRLDSAILPSREPAIGGLAVDAEFAGHFGLAQAPVKESGGGKSALFELLEVTFDTFRVTHAPKVSLPSTSVTILYRHQ